jgi:hypothetical protein
MAADDSTRTTEPTNPPTSPPADPPEDWKPPTKDEVERMQRALAKANAEAKDWRTKHKALTDQHSTDADKAAREQAEAAERKYKPLAVRAAAKAAFLEAGLQGGTPERVAKLVRMLDLDSIAIDDDGDVRGLDEQVKAVKADYPELFTTPDKRPPRVSAGDKPPTNGRVLSTGEKIAAQVLGR